MTAELINIGDELLNGYIVNTNASWLGMELQKLGVSLAKTTVISDKESAILDRLKEVQMTKHSIVIFTGGLGPTNDDITKEVLSNFFKAPLELDVEVLERVTLYFEQKNIPMAEVNKNQALVPKGFKTLKNDYGTAPGLFLEYAEQAFFFLPGVPFEMKHLFNTHLIPYITSLNTTEHIVIESIITRGIGESALAERIKDWEQSVRKEGYGLAYLPKMGSVTLRLSKIGPHKAEMESKIKGLFDELKTIIPDYIPQIQVSGSEEYLGVLLRSHQKTISIAESCTGGYLSHLISKVPGCSDYFKGSMVSYANEIKINELQVNAQNIEKEGAVSAVVVEQMAQHMRTQFKTDYSISTSGIAGPTGATPHKPVGLIWMGFSSKDKTVSKKIQLKTDRQANIEIAAQQALISLIKLIEEDGF